MGSSLSPECEHTDKITISSSSIIDADHILLCSSVNRQCKHVKNTPGFFHVCNHIHDSITASNASLSPISNFVGQFLY